MKNDNLCAILQSIKARRGVDLGLVFVLAGLVLLALGGVFDRGGELQQDHDLTV